MCRILTSGAWRDCFINWMLGTWRANDETMDRAFFSNGLVMSLNMFVFDGFVVICFSQSVFTIFKLAFYVDDEDIVVVFDYYVWVAFIRDTRELLVNAYNARFYCIG